MAWWLFVSMLLVGGWAWIALGRRAEADWGRAWLNRLDGLNRLFCRVYHRLRADPLPLPAQGPAVLVANHLSGLDPLLLIASARRPLRFLIAREQYERFGLRWLFRAVGCIPVDRSRRPELALREALRALRAGEVVAIFPQGRIHVPGRDAPPRIKPGAVYLARQLDCPLVPCRVDGVGAPGWVVGAVWVPSRARVSAFAPRRCPRPAPCLSALECILNAPDLELARNCEGERAHERVPADRR